ncbi:hypothetical protein L6E12_30910 [Actinokineospora sp. PR83]|uniref:hypothetical protein n=1 Tax=Actinokineospora sp. PR83 TaxID=2884908 RepID=UPI001F39F750|nr:hypothetical protein [Actinokineospora sp. PR83]MCG8920192.1 hypothetical protein [Actinokineospora sp. PR83]
MRITCFVLGVLCLLGSAGFVVLGTLNLGDSGSSSRPTTANFRTQVVVYDEPDLDDFGPATTLAGVLAVAGAAWMVGAVAFAPRRVAPAPQPQQWQAPQYGPPQQQYPQPGPLPQQAQPQHGHPQQSHGQQPPQSG